MGFSPKRTGGSRKYQRFSRLSGSDVAVRLKPDRAWRWLLTSWQRISPLPSTCRADALYSHAGIARWLNAGGSIAQHGRQCAGRRTRSFSTLLIQSDKLVKCWRNFKSLCAGNAGEAENARGGKSASPARVIVHSTCRLHAASMIGVLMLPRGPDFEAVAPAPAGG